MGNYTEFRTRKRPIVLDIPTPIKRHEIEAAVELRIEPTKTGQKKQAKGKTRTIEDVERDIEKAEEQVGQLEEEVSQAALQGDAEQLTRLSTAYAQARARVEELLKEWEMLGNATS